MICATREKYRAVRRTIGDQSEPVILPINFSPIKSATRIYQFVFIYMCNICDICDSGQEGVNLAGTSWLFKPCTFSIPIFRIGLWLASGIWFLGPLEYSACFCKSETLGHAIPIWPDTLIPTRDSLAGMPVFTLMQPRAWIAESVLGVLHAYMTDPQ